MVIDFSVEDEDEAPVGRVHGLRAALRQFDDSEAPMAERGAGRLVDEHCAGVGSAMMEGGRHRLNLGARVDRRRKRQSARYSAHSRLSGRDAIQRSADSCGNRRRR